MAPGATSPLIQVQIALPAKALIFTVIGPPEVTCPGPIQSLWPRKTAPSALNQSGLTSGVGGGVGPIPLVTEKCRVQSEFGKAEIRCRTPLFYAF